VVAKPGDFIFVEEPPKVRNMRVFGQLSMSAGAILSATETGYLVPVDSWKAAVIGRGGVGKPDVAEWLRVHHPKFSEECEGDQNLVDAACIALYGQQLLSRGELGAVARDLDSPL
jgi:hypothetical protein